MANNESTPTPAPPDKKAAKAAKKTAKQVDDKLSPKKKQSEPMGAMGMFVVCVLLFMIMAVVGVSFLFFNLMGARDSAVKLLTRGDTTYEVQRKELEQAILSYNDDVAALNIRAEELAKQQQTLEKTAKQQDQRAKDLDARQDEIDKLFAAFQTRVADFDQLVAVYGAMDSAKAAQALSLLENIDDIARLLSSLKKDKAAQILNNMDAPLAASVTARMLP